MVETGLYKGSQDPGRVPISRGVYDVLNIVYLAQGM